MPEREKAICQRAAEVRRDTHLSRVAFARRLGIDSTTFANYEYGRVPLPYRVAVQLCSEFLINPRWLADGIAPKRTYIKFGEYSGPPRALFSKQYDKYLKKELCRSLDLVEDMIKIELLKAEEAFEWLRVLDTTLTSIPEALSLILAGIGKNVASWSETDAYHFFSDVLKLYSQYKPAQPRASAGPQNKNAKKGDG